MTMYLSNRDIRSTGYEPGEFIEPVPTLEPRPGRKESGVPDDDEERPSSAPDAKGTLPRG
jgi:hypothetical protein